MNNSLGYLSRNSLVFTLDGIRSLSSLANNHDDIRTQYIYNTEREFKPYEKCTPIGTHSVKTITFSNNLTIKASENQLFGLANDEIVPLSKLKPGMFCRAQNSIPAILSLFSIYEKFNQEKERLGFCLNEHKDIFPFDDFVEWTTGNQLSFIRGIFKSIMYIDKLTDKKICLSSNNRNLLSATQQVLSTLGIRGELIICPTTDDAQNKEYDLSFTTKSSGRLIKMIGLHKHKELYEYAKNEKDDPNYLQIISIDQVADEEVIGFPVSVSLKTFFVNGISVHC